mmetsp:Transcript_49949/g.108521  ORF Transcript_49949/g.108521 Transcript_49949/m.108521 type:complete len:134 (-) Transcript_49949:214-615(-)
MVGAPPLQPAALPLADSVSLPMTLSLAEHEMAALYQDASESPSLWVAPPSESLASDSELWTAPSSLAAALLVDAVTQTVTLTPSCAACGSLASSTLALDLSQSATPPRRLGSGRRVYRPRPHTHHLRDSAPLP